jgi:hypothetical protein
VTVPRLYHIRRGHPTTKAGLRLCHGVDPAATRAHPPWASVQGPCVLLPCLAGGPSADTPAPSSFALPWAEVTPRACSCQWGS